ncbi:hypothetical protein [Xanthomonas arboricola]|uniref:hypothetical protein n=1 Tax=Xanthomonas arboricola TaxID=56448 RepID=UPI0012DB29E7|nr:hypothetical protein [Xanthomonas arboricola]
MIKTFFGIVKNEEPREAIYGTQRKVFQQYAQALRSVSLDSVADFRLLVPMHRTAAACDAIAELLVAPMPKNGSPELVKWFADLKKAQAELNDSYRRACVAHFKSTSGGIVSVMWSATESWRARGSGWMRSVFERKPA